MLPDFPFTIYIFTNVFILLLTNTNYNGNDLQDKFYSYAKLGILDYL